MRCLDNHYRPTLELLEQRELPATAQLYGSLLYVTSTAHHQFITVSESSGRLSVQGTPIHVGSRTVSSESASQVSEVIVYATGGGDVINLRPSAATTVSKPTYIYAAGGNNQVYGGSGTNYIVGAGGYNNLNGGPGTDYIAGGPTDTFHGGGGFDWYYRNFNPSDPFDGGDRVSDIRQGQAPSCQADAALAEAVKQGFNFSSSIHYLGSSTYEVTLKGGAVHERVHFNGWYNTDDPIPAQPGEFWTVLMYRARLEMYGINPNRDYSTAQWNALNQSTGTKLYSVADAITTFTGRRASFGSIGYAQTMATELARGDYLVATTPPGGGVSADGIIYDHSYAVMSIYYQGGMWKVQLYNPWGFDSVNGKTIESLAGGPPQNKGFITLSWQQFINSTNFQGVTRAAANAAQTRYFMHLSGSRE